MPMEDEAIHVTVRDMLDVIEDSMRQSNTMDYHEVDGVSFALHHSSSSLGQILNDVLIYGDHLLEVNIISSVRELHMCVTHLSVEWETRLFQLSHGSSLPRSSLGHPTLSINIPMVCIKWS